MFVTRPLSWDWTTYDLEVSCLFRLCFSARNPVLRLTGGPCHPVLYLDASFSPLVTFILSPLCSYPSTRPLTRLQSSGP